LNADRRCARPHLLFGFRRTGAGHDDHFVASNPHVADGHDCRFGFEGPAGELVRLRDAQHLVDAFKHLDQPLVRMTLTDRPEHGPGDTGRPVHVHAHLHEAGHDLFDLRLAGPFFHDYDHCFGCLHCPEVHERSGVSSP
jgi:hypothetical protein